MGTFTGQRREASLGLVDYGARMYDPALGRFLQADTLVPSPSNPQAFNRYLYVLGNPLKYTDPTGHMADWRALYDGGAPAGRLPDLPYGRGYRIPNARGLDTLLYAQVQLEENSKEYLSVPPFEVLEGNPMVHPETFSTLGAAFGYPSGDLSPWVAQHGLRNFPSPMFNPFWDMDPLTFGDALTSYSFAQTGLPFSSSSDPYTVRQDILGVLRQFHEGPSNLISDESYHQFTVASAEIDVMYIPADLEVTNQYRLMPEGYLRDKFWQTNAEFPDNASLARRWVLNYGTGVCLYETIQPGP